MVVSSGEKREGNTEALWPLLLEAVAVHNVLPLTSSCNLRCFFCSHRQNPPGIRVSYFPSLPLVLLAELIPLLDGSRKIVIGESSTRLCEGEPLMHPHFLTVIKEIRKKFPSAPLQITTNGTLLTKSLLLELVALKEGRSPGAVKSQDSSLSVRYPANLELVISLNSSTPPRRAKIMGDPEPQRVLEAIDLCRKYALPFHGSIVACPDYNGWEDLKQTLFFLEEMGVLTTRVFLPGRTRFSVGRPLVTFSLWKELHDFLQELRDNLEHPVLLEPPLKGDLRAEVEGVIRSSPAQQAGLKRKDTILRVNGEQVLTSVDAFYKIQKAADPLLEILRTGKGGQVPENLKENHFLRLSKRKGEPSGLVLSYDLDAQKIAQVATEIERKKAKAPFLFTSRAAALLWEAAQRESLVPEKVCIDVVENAFWGGTICCAGLLTVYDFTKHLRKIIIEKKEPDLIIIPLKPFDRSGRDLRGEHYEKLSAAFPQFSFSFL